MAPSKCTSIFSGADSNMWFFCHADSPTWDPRYHGSIMMVPVLYCACILCIIGVTFGVFVLLRVWQYRVAKRPFRAQGREPHDEEEVNI